MMRCVISGDKDNDDDDDNGRGAGNFALVKLVNAMISLSSLQYEGRILQKR